MESIVRAAIKHYTADDLIIRIPVTFEPGAAITTLTGATIVAWAKAQGADAVAGSVAIDPGGAECVASWPENALPEGVYDVQVRAAKDGYTRTLLNERIAALPSLP